MGKKMRSAIITTGLILLSVLLLATGASMAATAPGFSRLLTVGNQEYPKQVAADGAGNIYAGDTVSKSVKIYSSGGVLVKTIGLPSVPAAVAISPDGKLYVGVEPNAQGSMEVYSLDGTHIQSLDLGFSPAAITFTGSGEMYVIDSVRTRVRVYSGTIQVREFGGYGTGAGSFVDPQSLAINEAAGEVYVLDRGQETTDGGYTTYVWRVQVFDLQGTYLRYFSNYGFGQDGKLGSASSIAVDEQGRIYVADNTQGIVAVYDSAGAYLTTIYDNQAPIRTPADLNYINNRLYIASPAGKEVIVYGIDAYSTLRVTPLSLTLQYQAGMGNPSGAITLNNDGTGNLSYQGASDMPWLSITPISGDIAGGASQAVTITADPAGMAQGSYSGTITVTSNGGSGKAAVTLEVVTAPVLSVTPNSFITQARAGDTVAPLGVTIELANDLSGSRQWQAASDAAWLSIDKASGPSNTLVAVNLGVLTTMGVGAYTGHITVTADGAVGSPAVVAVNLELLSSGKITVSTNNTGASFTITGPQNYSGSGTSYEATGVVAGDYTITYGAVAGFKTPLTETKTLAEGAEIQFQGDYKDLRQSVDILASHGPGSKDPADIIVYRADGTAAMTIKPFLTNYGVTTAVGDVDGDGQQDIIAGAGPGSKVNAEIKGYKKDGTAIAGLDFLAFNTKFGVVVATADFDGDGKDEIIAGQGKTSSGVRIFSYANGTVRDTGVNITAYPGINLGAVVAAGDVDGDNVPELITGPEEATVIPVVNIYRIDTSLGMGKWSATLMKSINACSGASGVNIAAGDINADAVAEILVVCPASTGTTVNIMDMQGTVLSTFPTGSIVKDFIAAGDTNMDGAAEVIIGDGAVNKAKRVKVFDALGVIQRTIDAFTTSTGVRVSIGNLGY